MEDEKKGVLGDDALSIENDTDEKNDEKVEKNWLHYLIIVAKTFAILLCLYSFICSIEIVSTSMRLLAGKAMGKILENIIIISIIIIFASK